MNFFEIRDSLPWKSCLLASGALLWVLRTGIGSWFIFLSSSWFPPFSAFSCVFSFPWFLYDLPLILLFLEYSPRSRPVVPWTWGMIVSFSFVRASTHFVAVSGAMINCWLSTSQSFAEVENASRGYNEEIINFFYTSPSWQSWYYWWISLYEFHHRFVWGDATCHEGVKVSSSSRWFSCC